MTLYEQRLINKKCIAMHANKFFKFIILRCLINETFNNSSKLFKARCA